MKNFPRTLAFAIRQAPPMLAILALAGLLSLAARAEVEKAPAAPKAEARPAIDPKADELMRRMCDYLAQAAHFSVDAEVWQDIQLGSGQQVQAGRTIELQVRRPDRFHAEVRSTRRNRGLFYDGKSITLLNRIQNLYGIIPAPPTLDGALDTASEHFGIALPLEDIIVSDPYKSGMRKVRTGIHLGQVSVLGVQCEHLAFSLGKVDWQIWIEQGARPVPRKIVITYKDEEATPQYTAILSHWDFQTPLPDFLFTFEPPNGAKKVDVKEIAAANAKHAAPEPQKEDK